MRLPPYTSVKEDGASGYCCEIRTCLPLPLNRALNFLREEDAKPAVPEQKQRRTAKLRLRAPLLVSAGERSVKRAGKSHKLVSKSCVFSCTFPTQIQATFSIRRKLVIDGEQAYSCCNHKSGKLENKKTETGYAQ
jgi:hypothetical protein